MMRWIYLLLILLSLELQAFDNPYTMRSPEGLLMGDAFTAVNHDEFTLFYNPASLHRHEHDLTLTPFNPQGSGTNLLSDADKFKDFPDEPVGASKVLMDYPVHASAGIAPGFKMFNVGVTFLATQSYDVLLRNQAYPMLDLDLHSDKGLIMGIGIPLGSGRLSKKSKSGSQTSFGLAGKYIERTGVADRLALVGPTVLESLSKKDMSDILKTLGEVKGKAVGFDAGLEHVLRGGSSSLIMGISALDIGGTNFSEAKTPENLKVANIRSQVNVGMAAGQDFKIVHYLLSADVRALNEEMDFGKRLRLGAQFGIPGITFLGGINSGYYSYGAMLDFAFLKLTAGFYSVELGSKYKQVESKRFVIYLSLFDFSFDA